VAEQEAGERAVGIDGGFPDYRLAKKLEWGSAIPDSML
jgi:hypothetical protein